MRHHTYSRPLVPVVAHVPCGCWHPLSRSPAGALCPVRPRLGAHSLYDEGRKLMQIIEVNHKTVTNLLKKSVEKSWMGDNLDAWFQFTDGSAVCIHVIETNWNTYVAVDNPDKNSLTSFQDEQGIIGYEDTKGKQQMYTSRTLLIHFDKVRYYYHRNFGYATRQYLAVAEFHYYGGGETWE